MKTGNRGGYHLLIQLILEIQLLHQPQLHGQVQHGIMSFSLGIKMMELNCGFKEF